VSILGSGNGTGCSPTRAGRFCSVVSGVMSVYVERVPSTSSTRR
jgi:hypothetical protein